MADGGGHLGRQTGRQRRQDGRRRRIGQQPIAKFADGQMRDRRERRPVVRIDDQPGDFVGFVGNDVLVQKGGQRQIGKGILRGHALLDGSRRTPASPSPLRAGVALASSVFKSPNT